MKKVYGYIRVSTVKQGTGVSLQEQKEAILRYAEKHELQIVEWFEEQETAAKQGRPLFTKMMKLLQGGKAHGVIIHKIDRSARNLKDWASLGDLIDKGIEVHFAHESLDMDTRGGRLAADIQAVIASDYIRNLRDEAKKGLYGRLKQGIYPFGAPIGYLNNGGGKVKTIDPVSGPLVKQAFSLYASGKFTLDTLAGELKGMGLKNSKGRHLSKPSISAVLNNPFYAGVLKVKGGTFQGAHVPLVPAKTFKQVQDVLAGKTNAKVQKHEFLFRRMVKCADCNYSLVGERQKGISYYRCHTKGCPSKCIREEQVEKTVLSALEKVQLLPQESQALGEILAEAQGSWSADQKRVEDALNMQIGRVAQKLERLTEAYIEAAVDKAVFEQKKQGLFVESQGLRHQKNKIAAQKEGVFRKAKKFLELLKSFKNTYISANMEEKRKILNLATSNLSVQGRKLMFTMLSPFEEIANRGVFSSSGLDCTTPRISRPENANLTTSVVQTVDNPALRESMKELLDWILHYFESNNGIEDELEL